jgi:hypothetical protein
MKIIWISSLLLMFVATCFVGCNKAALRKTIDSLPLPDESAEEEESEFQTPIKMVVTWSDTVLQRAGSPPTRGFGGRIYFYNDNSQAISVEGDLVVYAFDDSNMQSPERKAERKFVFTAEQFTKHYSKTDLGASYSVWLPFGPLGAEQREVSLLPVFRTKTEKVVLGAQTKNILPGRKHASVIDADNGGYLRSQRQKPLFDAKQVSLQMERIQALQKAGLATNANHVTSAANDRSASQVAYHQPMRDYHSTTPQKMKTATIGLPNSMAKRVLRPIEPAEHARRIHSWNRPAQPLRDLKPPTNSGAFNGAGQNGAGQNGGVQSTVSNQTNFRGSGAVGAAGVSAPPQRLPAPQVRSGLERFPVQAGPNALQSRVNDPSSRRLAKRQSFLPSQQTQNVSPSTSATWSAVGLPGR